MRQRIFLSYRRTDTQELAHRIFDKLEGIYGREAIFFDKEGMIFSDFRKHIREQVKQSSVVMVLIGPGWAQALREREGSEDHVRAEIETALEHQIALAPVLVATTPMPNTNELPSSIAALTRYHAEWLSAADDFHYHMDRITKRLEASFGLRRKDVSPASSIELTDALSKLQQLVAAINNNHESDAATTEGSRAKHAAFGRMFDAACIRAPAGDVMRAAGCREEDMPFVYGKRMGRTETAPVHAIASLRDLGSIYTPVVGRSVLAIAANNYLAYDVTSKGNLIAVVSNGTSILGLGGVSAAAAKPVLEAKCSLMKHLAHLDAFDLEIDATSVERFVDCVASLGPTFGAVCLEDIRAPECFEIERQLQSRVDIPVYHDDQHSIAICIGAAVLNAVLLTRRALASVKVVVIGAGAAALATLELLHSLGILRQHITICDVSGVVFEGRKTSMDEHKAKWATSSPARTLAEALAGADAVIGLSVSGVLTESMVRTMNEKPIVFALGSPRPEIAPEALLAARPDALYATQLNNYPNQIGGHAVSAYMFRGLLDARATSANMQVKCAAAAALAELAREGVSADIAMALQLKEATFGETYLVPDIFDPRLLSRIAPAVARAAKESGVARGNIIDYRAYASALARLSEELRLGLRGIRSQSEESG